MNENLARDFYDSQMAEIAKIAKKLDEIAERPNDTQEIVDKLYKLIQETNNTSELKGLIANIKLPTQDNSEFKNLTNQLQESMRKVTNSITQMSSNLDHTIKVARAPIVKQNEYIFSFRNVWGVGQVLISMVLIGGLSAALVFQNMAHEDARIGDLKYRYSRMCDDTSGFFQNLDDAIENDPDGKNLRYIEEKVEAFEKAIADKVKAEELARMQSAKAAAAEEMIEKIKQ